MRPLVHSIMLAVVMMRVIPMYPTDFGTPHVVCMTPAGNEGMYFISISFVRHILVFIQSTIACHPVINYQSRYTRKFAGIVGD